MEFGQGVDPSLLEQLATIGGHIASGDDSLQLPKELLNSLVDKWLVSDHAEDLDQDGTTGLRAR